MSVSHLTQLLRSLLCPSFFPLSTSANTFMGSSLQSLFFGGIYLEVVDGLQPPDHNLKHGLSQTPTSYIFISCPTTSRQHQTCRHRLFSVTVFFVFLCALCSRCEKYFWNLCSFIMSLFSFPLLLSPSTCTGFSSNRVKVSSPPS